MIRLRLSEYLTIFIVLIFVVLWFGDMAATDNCHVRGGDAVFKGQCYRLIPVP